MDTAAFLKHLEAQPDYDGQMVHIEQHDITWLRSLRELFSPELFKPEEFATLQ